MTDKQCRAGQDTDGHTSMRPISVPPTTTETTLHTAFAAITSGVVIQDAAGATVYANEAAQQILGLGLDQLRERTAGDPYWQTTREDGTALPAAEQAARLARQTGRPQRDVTVGFALPDGSRCWLQVDAVPVCDADSAVQQVVVTFRDITEQRHTAQSLQASEAGFRLLFAGNPQPMWVYDRQTLRFLEVNEAAIVHYGYSREEFLALRITDIRPPEDVPLLLADVREQRPALRGSGQWRHRLKDGRLINVEVTAHALTFAAREAVLVVIADITERTLAQEEQQRERRRSAFLSEATLLLASSLDYEITLASVARLVVPHLADWCSVHILSEDGLLSSLVVAHVDPAKVEMARELQRRLPPDPTSQHGTWQVIRTGQSEIIPAIPDELLVAAIPDTEVLEIVRSLGLKSSMCVPMIARERTLGAISFVAADSGRYGPSDLAMAEELARRAAMAVDNAWLYRQALAAEERVRQLNTDLEQRVVERTAELQTVNRELEAFAYAVSHDLRAPLRSVTGFSQAILEDYADRLDADGIDCLQQVIGASNDMAQLIDDLLRLSRVTRADLQRQQTDLSALARIVAGECARSAPERAVSCTIEAGLVGQCDSRLLRIVLENLLENAWKFTRHVPAASIEVGACVYEGLPAYFVRDNGAGFDMAYVGKLFGAFQRLHVAKEFEGTGIGLATVQRIIHRHGGEVWAEGAVGRGATFYFTLESAEGKP